jgi:hypothetical protein
MNLKLALLALTIALGFNSVAHAAPTPVIDEDNNPMFLFVDSKHPGKRFFSTKPLMQWQNGWFYKGRLEYDNGTKIYRLGYVDCLKNQVRIAHSMIIDPDNRIDMVSSDTFGEFLTVANSKDAVDIYCKYPRVNLPKFESMPIIRKKSEPSIQYFVTKRKSGVITVLFNTSSDIDSMYNQYGYHIKYNCNTRASKTLFSFHTANYNRMVEYETPSNPNWDEYSPSQSPKRNLEYENMVDTFCKSK